MSDTDNNEPLGMFDELMSRGERLRHLRLLAKADEEARQNNSNHGSRKKKISSSISSSSSLTSNSNRIIGSNGEDENVITHDSIDLVVGSKKTSKMLLPSLSSMTNLTESTYGGGSSNNSTNHCSIGTGDDNDDDLIKVQEEDEEDFTYDNDDDVDDSCSEEDVDKIDVLPDSKLRVLRYDSYLKHQRYNDDYKHADCHFIDFGFVRNCFSSSDNDVDHHHNSQKGHRLMIEQQKSLGKGGFVWDAGVVLAEHLIATKDDWFPQSNDTHSPPKPKIVELGAGTGVTGLMIAKVIRSHVYITDLPDVIRLMERNVQRNFHNNAIEQSASCNLITDEDLSHMDRGIAAQEVPTIQNLSSPEVTLNLSENDMEALYSKYVGIDEESVAEDCKEAQGTVTAKVLRWGIKEDYDDSPFDVIIAGDVVTTLYDPSALAQTMYDLSHETSIIYLCVKRRLNRCHESFEECMNELFSSVTFASAMTRHRNLKEISIMRATGKI